MSERISTTVPEFDKHLGYTLAVLDKVLERMTTTSLSRPAAQTHHDGRQYRALTRAVETDNEVDVIAKSKHTQQPVQSDRNELNRTHLINYVQSTEIK